MNEFLYKLNKFQWENYIYDKHHDLNIICNEIYDYLDKKKNLATLSKSELRRLVENDPSTVIIRNKIDYSYNDNFKEDIKIDVFSLMDARNKVSREFYFKGYVDLVMYCENLDFQKLKCLIDEYIEKNLSSVKRLTDKYYLTWENWFFNLKNIESIDLKDIEVDFLIDSFLRKFGFEEVLGKITIVYHKDMGYCTKISQDDIRICIREPNSIFDLRTLFHELGHGILYYYVSKEKDEEFFNITGCFDEFSAVLMENLAMNIMFSGDLSEKMKDIINLEYMRTALSASFEFDLWNSKIDPEELYIKHYSKLGLQMNNKNPWYKDSFRSLDSMYIHNYTLGQIIAEKLIKSMCKKYNEDNIKIGKYIKELFKENLNIIEFYEKNLKIL